MTPHPSIFLSAVADKPILGSTDSTNNSAMAHFGEPSRQLIKFIQNLESLGIDTALPSLPKIVVVGDQSHGKSSVIEALCDISLPRSEGTCTRCPFQITTTASSPNEAWNCKISLLRRYAYNAESTGGKYEQWEDTGSQNAIDFTNVTQKSELENALRLAQNAILNPQIAPNAVLLANDVEMASNSKISFSPNIIGLEISAPELPEISLLDLPGAIAVAENTSEQHIVPFVETLITSHVSDEKALILLTIAANQDTDTSNAFRFVRGVKAECRCVGVLTKPDLFTKSRQNTDRMIRTLNGKMFELGNGWYVTKQLSSEELDQNVSYAEARRREEAFFTRQEPWCTALADFSEQFGIPRLQDALSHKLTEHILNELPEIASRVTDRLRKVEDQLAAFPEQVKAPCSTVRNEIEKVNSVVLEHLSGNGIENEFRDVCIPVYPQSDQRFCYC